MSGNDGFRTDSIGYNTSFLYGDYLNGMAQFFTRSLAYRPGNIWHARNYTQALNEYSYFASQPYGFYYNFSGRPHYVVADPFKMPYQTAMALHGYGNGGAPTAAETYAQMQQMTNQAGLQARASQTAMDLEARLPIGQWKDNEALAEHPELKKEAKELAAKIENILKKIKEAMENKDQLTFEEVSAKVDALIEVAKPLIERANELQKECEEIAAEYSKEKAEKAAEEARTSAEDGDSSGETSVATTEGDKEMDTDELAEEYGVKAPVIKSDQDVSVIAQEVKTNTNNSNDEQNYKDFTAMFDTKKINAGNVVELLSELGEYDLYDGIYEMNNSKTVMTKLLSTISERIKLLKDNGYITAEEAKKYNDAVKLVKDNLGGDNEDISDSQATVGGVKLFDYLKREVINKLVNVGTQASFDAKIQAKQNERITKATADFYKDHATTRSGKEVNGTPSLPDGVTYLPNSKEFQWKYDSSTVFKGKSYRELNSKILDSKKTEVIAKWNEVLKTMDTKLKDKAAS